MTPGREPAQLGAAPPWLTRLADAAGGHENGPDLTSFAATAGSVGPSP